MRTWHDYHLTGYSVDGKSRQVAIEVSWPYNTSTDIRRATVVFSGVEGYFFENDLGGNILSSLAEEPLDIFIARNADQFNEKKKWGWPLFWRGSIAQTLEHLVAKDVKCIEITSSYGLTGWILATKVEHHVSEV